MAAERCLHCNEPILAGERVMPINDGQDLLHRECMIRMVMGSVAHQEERCSCFGGTGEDDPDLSIRENAKAAAAVADGRADRTLREAARKSRLASGMLASPWPFSHVRRYRHWILNGHQLVPVDDVLTWGKWFERATEDGSRVVGQDEIGGYMISTVFVGVDLNWIDEGPPLLFETMIFGERGSGDDLECRRYATWDDAAAGHAEMVARVRGIVAMLETSGEQGEQQE
jgi:hypothetical protein